MSNLGVDGRMRQQSRVHAASLCSCLCFYREACRYSCADTGREHSSADTFFPTQPITPNPTHAPTPSTTTTTTTTLRPTPSPTPINCVVSDWGAWTQCSEPCGTGYESHSRTILTEAEDGGVECPALDERRDCEMKPCTCEFTGWTKWSSCSASCGGGTTTRTREITKEARDGGTCSATEETATCSHRTCPSATNCVVSDWADWTQCSEPCGT